MVGLSHLSSDRVSTAEINQAKRPRAGSAEEVPTPRLVLPNIKSNESLPSIKKPSLNTKEVVMKKYNFPKPKVRDNRLRKSQATDIK